MVLEDKRPLASAPAAPGVPPALKPPVDPETLIHTHLRQGPFWQTIPAYAAVSEG
jgi:hypothetical protein